MKKFKELYNKLAEAAEGIEGYPPGFNTGSGTKRRVDGDSFGGFRVGEGNTISRINAFLNKYLQGTYMAGDYKFALRELRVRLNHIGLDFDSEKELVPGENRIKVKLHGDTFGTTPTTDLMKGFDKGQDLPSLTMIINYTHDESTGSCYMNGRITLDGSINESEQLDEIFPALLAALPTVAKVASTVGTVATAAGAVKDLVSPKQQEMGEDGMSPRKKRINSVKNILSKKKSDTINEIAPLIPILTGAARLLGPAIIGGVVSGAVERMTSGSKKSNETKPDTEPNTPPKEEPLTVAGVSNLNKWNRTSGPRKTVRPITRRLEEEKEEKSKKDRKDEPRVVEHFIMRNADVKNKVLLPIYNNLKKLKEKKKYSKDIAAKHLYYVVNYAIRKLNNGDTKITLSQIEKARVVDDLIRNFEKSVR